MSNSTPEESWSRLGLFLSRDVMVRRYREHHGVVPEEGKAVEIISHLEQARQYFRSADTAGPLAGPLEQYYGVLAFARAIILYRNADMREAELKGSHGLRARLRTAESPIEDITLKIEGGTFDELLDASGNVELAALDDHNLGAMIPMRLSAARHLQRPPRPSVVTTFGLVDLLSRIPDLREHFEEAFQRSAHCYVGRASHLAAAITVGVWANRFGLPTSEELRSSLGMATSWSAMATPHGGGVQFTRQLAEGEFFATGLPNVVEMPTRQHCIIEPFAGGWSLSQICALFAASNVISMLVRYYPTRWARLLSHEKGDSLLPVLERLRNLLQTDFVRLVLRELERVDPALG